MCAPGYEGRFRVVVTREIVRRNFGVDILGGEECESAMVAEGDVSVMINKDAVIKIDVTTAENLYAPIKKGQELGKAVFTSGGEILGEVKLVAPEDIGREKKPNIFIRIINWIMGK